MVEIRLLGPIEAAVNGELVDVGGVKQRTVLAALAARAGDWVSEDRLIHAVWGDGGPENALRSLQTYVSNLRALLDSGREGLIERGQGSYRLNPELAAVDAHNFEETLTGEGDRSVEELWKALALWRGRPLGELADDEWAGELVAHWERLHLQATGQLIWARMAEGQHAEMIDDLEGLVAAHPLHEPFWGQLMLALYRSGRQADALDAYSRVKIVLGEELGIEPGPDLLNLEEKILLQDPSLAAPTTTPNNLPAERTDLIGRESEIEEVLKLLESTRLLTLTGAGGVGKTRLAQAVAHQLLDKYPDGVWFVDLAPLGEADLVMKRIAAVLDVEPPVLRPVEEVVVEAIGGQQLLFVLDNCEHLIQAAAEAIDSLLDAPAVDIVATSRETLRVNGEYAWRVPSLKTPAEDVDVEQFFRYESVRLFGDRARAAEPSFRLGFENLTPVGSLCRHLDGIPLAIELAAARVSTLTPAELEQRLGQRFALLTGGARTSLPRHQTLEAAIEWSYELLSSDEQQLHYRLGVFAGSFDLTGANRVSRMSKRETLELLERLIAKSLIVPESAYGERRFHMLETVREYALDRLVNAGESVDAYNALLAWAEDLSRRLAPKLMGPDQANTADLLDLDLDNVRAALRWADDSGQVSSGLAVAASMARYWYLRGLSTEGARWFDRFLAQPDGLEPGVLVRGLIGSSATLVRLGRLEESYDQAKRAVNLLEGSGNQNLLGWAVYQQGVASYGLVPIVETRRLLQEAQEHFQEADNLIGWGLALLLEGPALVQVDVNEAARLMPKLLKLMEASDVPLGIAHALEGAAGLAVKTGDLEEAAEHYQRALEVYEQVRVSICESHCLDGVVMWLIESSRAHEAARLASGVEKVRRSLSTVAGPTERYFPEVDEFKKTMETHYPEAVREGQQMSRPELVDFAVDALRHSA